MKICKKLLMYRFKGSVQQGNKNFMLYNTLNVYIVAICDPVNHLQLVLCTGAGGPDPEF